MKRVGAARCLPPPLSVPSGQRGLTGLEALDRGPFPTAL
jgi:hypothetical protein